MTKYSFKCKQCEQEFTVNVPYEEKWDSICPHCGSEEKREVFKPLGHSSGQSVTERMGIQIPPPGQLPK